jgi:ectoine hydroxylase-related dioxygenase (phytanoyl-CoA dioxygenase family)
MSSPITADDVLAYEREGLLFLRGLFNERETGLLRETMERDPAIAEHSLLRADAEGLSTRISLWNRAGDATYGLVARSARLVDTVETLMGEPVYHFQSKLTAKDPLVGGAWEWHQDYGYWYYNGCIRPDMLSVMIALDRADADNGCLQLVRGSHRLGRIDHVPVSDKQNAADPARVAAVLERSDIVHCELEPGDAVVFHANTLHRSDQNRSDRRRWTFLVCYNAVSNDTLTRDDDRYYVPLDKVGDSAVLEAGVCFARGDNQEHFALNAYVPEVAHAST